MTLAVLIREEKWAWQLTYSAILKSPILRDTSNTRQEARGCHDHLARRTLPDARWRDRSGRGRLGTEPCCDRRVSQHGSTQSLVRLTRISSATPDPSANEQVKSRRHRGPLNCNSGQRATQCSRLRAPWTNHPLHGTVNEINRITGVPYQSCNCLGRNSSLCSPPHENVAGVVPC
jgi:hypothetical protein